MSQYLIARVLIWWDRLRCRHHWHAADPMIAVACCWCGKNTDGWPTSRTEACAFQGDVS